MYKLKINRRGVSPVIATLLLVAIAVAASVVTYTWAMSMVANQSAQSQTGIKIDQVMFGANSGGTGCGVLVTIRNTGSIAATVQTVSLFQGDKWLMSYDLTTGNVFSAGQAKSVGLREPTAAAWADLKSGTIGLPTPTTEAETLAWTTDLSVNTPYLVRVLTSTGFVVEGTYYSPGTFA